MADLATNPYRPSRSQFTVRLTPRMLDFWAFTLWVMVTYVVFDNDELLQYPLALYFMFAIWRDQRIVVPLIVRAWIPLVFVSWCLISPIWAVEPVTAFKTALYLLLTMLICYHVAAVLTARKVLYAVVIATGFIGVLCIYVGLTGGEMNRGVFLQKNAMGKSMIVLWTAALAVALDPGSSWRVRVASALTAAMGLFLGFASESATAVLLMLATGSVLVFGSIVLVGGINRPSRLILLFGFIAIVFFCGALILPTFQGNPVDMVLERFGKDSTLTGRTGLWAYADDQIEKAPVLGVGAGGFWRYHASPLVQMIFEEYNKNSRATFNFHNSYYEITVHQGMIGLFFAVTAIVWAQLIIMRGALTLATMPVIFFLAQSVAVLARTFTESDFLRPFVLFHMVFWIGAFLILKEEMRRRGPSRKTRTQAKIRRSLLRQ
ncbi:MAG: O-antigen ligase family protein [Pseudomonadota bacterium]